MNSTSSETSSFGSFFSRPLLRLISCEDMGVDTLSCRFDDGDRAIENGAQLLVAQGQVAQFVYLGRFGDVFAPGNYKLVTDNIPILTAFKSWKFGFHSPFKADVFFVSTKRFTGCKWGTTNPVMLHDSHLGVVRVMAHGTYDFHIVNPSLFLSQVAVTSYHFTCSQFEDALRSRVSSSFAQAVALSGLEVATISNRYSELGESLLPILNHDLLAAFGIELTALIVEAVTLPEGVAAAIDAASSIAAVGDLTQYLKFQLGEGLAASSGASAPTEMLLGMGLAREMVGKTNLLGSAPSPSLSALPAVTPVPTFTSVECDPLEALPLAKVADLLSVPIEKVEAAVESGEIPSFKVLGEVRVRREILNKLMGV